MATSSINITLPEPLKAYEEAQADSGAFGTPSDFIRELILDDRDRRRRNLEEHLLDALNHEEDSVEISDEEWQSADLVEILRARLPPTV
jgi:antitoxin ParD1/3/4